MLMLTALGTTITDLNGITSLDVDNVTIDGNAISTSDSNGNLSLAPNGTGVVTVPSGYEGRAGFSADALVNKSYVDSVANGLDVKASVRVATTGNLSATYNNGAGTLTSSANGAISIDSVTLTTNDRVLVKDQSSGFQNGFYKVTQIGDAGNPYILTRTPDADAASELTSGAFTFSEEGTTNGDNGYVMSTNGAVTLGTTNIVFEQFSGAGQITAGTALTKTGTPLAVNVDDSSIEVSGDALQIKASGVGTNQIANLAVTAGKLAGTLDLSGKTLTLPTSFTTNTFTVAGDSGTQAIDLADTLTVSGGEGIDTSQSGDTLTIAAELATSSNKGVASFSTDNFAVSTGVVMQSLFRQDLFLLLYSIISNSYKIKKK